MQTFETVLKRNIKIYNTNPENDGFLMNVYGETISAMLLEMRETLDISGSGEDRWLQIELEKEYAEIFMQRIVPSFGGWDRLMGVLVSNRYSHRSMNDIIGRRAEEHDYIRRAIVIVSEWQNGGFIECFYSSDEQYWGARFRFDSRMVSINLEVYFLRFENDGNYTYLQIPQNVWFQKRGIAWTFGLPAETYKPDMET